ARAPTSWRWRPSGSRPRSISGRCTTRTRGASGSERGGATGPPGALTAIAAPPDRAGIGAGAPAGVALTGPVPSVQSGPGRHTTTTRGAGGFLKPAPFAYVRARAIEEVFDLLAQHGDEARLLAGGQSLIPTLNLRLSAPRVLIDINGLDALAGIEVTGGGLRIGALTRQRAVERSAEVARCAPLIAMAMPHIAHPAVRNRGTIGGSIAYADP